MNAWLLAARNLLRNERRSLATVLALALGALSTLIFGGFSKNIQNTMLTAYVRTGGHLQIQHRDFFLYGNGNPSAYGILDYPSIVSAIKGDRELGGLVAVATPKIQFEGIAGNYAAGVSRTVVGTGLVAPEINLMRKWNERRVPLDSPRFVLEGAPADAAIVGIGLARVLLLCEPLRVSNCPTPERQRANKDLGNDRPVGSAKNTLPPDIAALEGLDRPANAPRNAESTESSKEAKKRGAKVEILSSQSGGAPNVAALDVIDAEDQGFKEWDEVAVIVHFDQARSLVYGRREPKASAIMVQLHSTARREEAAAALRVLLTRVAPAQSLAVLDFETLNPFYVQTMDLFNMIFGFIFLLIGAIVLFTVGNTMNAAVVERTIEVGTLRAIGLRQRGVSGLFVMEGALLGVAGTLLGVALAVVAAALVNVSSLTWLPPGSSERLPLTLKIWGEWPMVFGVAMGLIVIATLSAWLPARRAARLKIVDALRHV